MTVTISVPEIILYPFQAVAGVEDDRWEENIEEHFRVKGHLSHIQKTYQEFWITRMRNETQSVLNGHLYAVALMDDFMNEFIINDTSGTA